MDSMKFKSMCILAVLYNTHTLTHTDTHTGKVSFFISIMSENKNQKRISASVEFPTVDASGLGRISETRL